MKFRKINIYKISIITFIIGGIVLGIFQIKGWGWLIFLAFVLIIFNDFD